MTLDKEDLRQLLARYKSGETGEDALLDELLKRGYEDIEFAKVDHRRKGRTGYPEVIYGEGKMQGVSGIRPAEMDSILRYVRALTPSGPGLLDTELETP